MVLISDFMLLNLYWRKVDVKFLLIRECRRLGEKPRFAAGLNRAMLE